MLEDEGGGSEAVGGGSDGLSGGLDVGRTGDGETGRPGGVDVGLTGPGEVGLTGAVEGVTTDCKVVCNVGLSLSSVTDELRLLLAETADDFLWDCKRHMASSSSSPARWLPVRVPILLLNLYMSLPLL